MTPNNQIITKFNESEDKNEEIFSGLKKLILEENKCISYTYVSLKFGVHVKQAIEVLDKFVAEERNNGSTLSVNYLLSGNNDTSDDDNEIKMERFMIINESDMDSSIDWFKNGVTKHIYSVGFGEDNDKIELNFDEFDYEVKDKNDLNDLQKLRYLKNPNIEFRNARRRVGIKPIVHKTEDKTSDLKTTQQIKSNSNDNKESKTKSKTKTNSKAKNSKKNKISNMFSKNKKEVKVENEEKESDDPFGSDSEEDIKPEIEDKDKDLPSDKDKSGSDDEEIIEAKNKPMAKNRNKRHSKNDSDNSEDEEIFSSKKKSKKFKRIRLISDSDSDDVKEESPLDKFVSTKNHNSKPIKKIKEVKESHIDEDGYVVTKTVKKEVEDNEESKADKCEDKSEHKSEDKEKTKQNPKKNNEKKAEKKPPKPSKDTKSKTQSSITSFFKPKQIST